jgi:hypothetical protein
MGDAGKAPSSSIRAMALASTVGGRARRAENEVDVRQPRRCADRAPHGTAECGRSRRASSGRRPAPPVLESGVIVPHQFSSPHLCGVLLLHRLPRSGRAPRALCRVAFSAQSTGEQPDRDPGLDEVSDASCRVPRTKTPAKRKGGARRPPTKHRCAAHSVERIDETEFVDLKAMHPRRAAVYVTPAPDKSLS